MPHREPILITQHRVPSAYLVDVETFENFQRRITLVEGIVRGKAFEVSDQAISCLPASATLVSLYAN